MPLTDARCRSAQPGPTLQKLTDGGGRLHVERPSYDLLADLAEALRRALA